MRALVHSAILVSVLILTGCQGPAEVVPQPNKLRIATLNASLHRAAPGKLVADLTGGGDVQARAVAEIMQRVRPDIVLINEFDYDAEGRSAALFQKAYLAVGQNGAAPIEYPHVFLAGSNTGVPSGHDLDNDGAVGGPGDAHGYGAFQGQYGMLVLSRHPIVRDRVRTFQTFLWKAMPGALLPDDPQTPAPADWYAAPELDTVRLSSKSHWDVPIDAGGRVIHLLASHPTPPVFDGPEDRNGRRNHDEIRFWADYVVPARSAYIIDDQGQPGGLTPGAPFVIAGDLNADPHDGESVRGAIAQLLEHPSIRAAPVPTSPAAREHAERDGGANATHRGDPAADTADFRDDPGPGNLRVDYVLCSTSLEVTACGVFWPVAADPLARLVGASDHRMVWVDVGGRD